MFTSTHVLSWLLSYQYAVLFPLAIVESPTISLLAGFLASIGTIDPVIALPLIVIANALSDIATYAAGKWGGEKLLEKYGGRFGWNVERMEKLKTHFKNHPGKTILIGKFSHIISIPILFASGMGRVPFRDFLIFSCLGTLIKSIIFMALGFYVGQAYATFDRFFRYAGHAAIILFIITSLGYVIAARFSKRYFNDHGN